MTNRTLTTIKGPITHSVFDTVPATTEEVVDGDLAAAAQAPVDILETFKHVYIPEVVREPLISYQKVPRLGCYMAIPLIYESCLSVESLEQAIADKISFNSQTAEQTREM